jgi:2-polyprenyl-6-methoxyphenol hydroxylase-like FAD-dependent oxidoreductase
MLSGLQDRVHFRKEATGFEALDDGVTLRFSDGTTTFASMAVGADGVRSPLYRQLLPDHPVIDTGFRAIYGKTPLIVDGRPLVPRPLENSGVMASSGPGRIFFFTTMRFKRPPADVFAELVPDREPPIGGDYVMWALVFPKEGLPENLWSLSADSLHQLALDASRAYHPVLQEFVRSADKPYTVATELSTSTQPKAWGASRATLMGDAVHVMPPTGAHGGNTALRDAATLAGMLKEAAGDGKPLERAIQAYQEEMVVYAFKEVREATGMLNRGNMKNPVARWFMFGLLPWMRPFRNQS